MNWDTALYSRFNYKRYRVLIHVLFWISYLVLYSVNTSSLYDSYTFLHTLKRYSLTIPVDIIATYFTAYYLIPKYIYNNRYVIFIVYVLVSAIAFIFLSRVIIYFITYPLLFPDYVEQVKFFSFNYIYAFLNIYSVVAIVSVVRLAKKWIQQQRKTEFMQQEKLKSELNFLKAQIHPHFLFNTLNNLYALTLEKSVQAPEVVVKLSALLDYMLYQCNEPFVPLKKEINLIKDYLSLESLRYKSNLKVDFEIKGSADTLKIAPLLLLPFVENSFKHGLSKVAENPWIKVILIIDEAYLYFDVENSKSDNNKTRFDDYTKGIGLKNVRRRLELIYPDKFTLEISDNKDVFKTRLTLQILD